MDKNMINVDDFFRQNLEDGEIAPRSGAWVNMRHLLDENMPLNPPKRSFFGRKYFGLLLGLLLLTSATVGGYHVLHNNKNGHQESINTVGIPYVNNNITSTKTDQSINPKETEKANISASVSSTLISNSRNEKNIAKAIRKFDDDAKHTLPVTVKVGNKESNIGTTNSTNQTPIIKNYSNKSLSQNKNKTEKHFASNSNKDVIKEIAKPDFEDFSSNTASSTNNSSANFPQPAPLKPQLTKDTFQQLQVIQRFIINPLTRESRIVRDTVAVTKIAIDRVEPLADNDELIASKGNNESFDQALLNAGIGNQIVPLANLKIRSHKTSYWNARSFNEVVNDLKFNISQIKFYPGISIGYNNYILKTTAFNGFHFGFAGLFTLDNWALMTELKYFNRINSDYSINDSYVESAGAGLQQKVDHFFKIASLQSIEMPIAMRYTVNRLNIFAGINTTYVFGLNPEEVTHYNQPEPFSQSTYNAAASVSVNDFNNRIGIGGLMGVSYDLVPSMQLDLRATRNVWDNLNSRGGLIVARELFRVPSFQVSFTYRFSQQSRYPKAK